MKRKLLAGWLGCDASAQALSIRLETSVLPTLGGDGAEASTDGEPFPVEAMKIDVKDTTAVGDCFVGVLASALDKGLTLKAAMERASIAAGLACSRPGIQSSIPSRRKAEQAESRKTG